MLKTVSFGHSSQQNSRDTQKYIPPEQTLENSLQAYHPATWITWLLEPGLIDVAIAEEIDVVIGDLNAGLLLDSLNNLRW